MAQIANNLARFLNLAKSTDPTRFHLCSVHASFVGDVLWLCATDGHRLHAVRAPEGTPPGWVDVAADGTITRSQNTELTGNPEAKFPPIEQVWCGDSTYTSKLKRYGVERMRLLAAARKEWRRDLALRRNALQGKSVLTES